MAIPGLRSWIPADTATAKSSICIATACPTNGLTSFEEWVIHSVDPSVGLDVQSLQNLLILNGFTRQNNLDQVLRWDLVQPQVFGQPVHAATELDFGIHLSRGVLGVDFVHCKKKGGVTFWPNLVKKNHHKYDQSAFLFREKYYVSIALTNYSHVPIQRVVSI